jgi:tRNA 2-selenouridine synthase
LSSERIYSDNFRDLFIHQRPLIDVRAPIEFQQGHLPGAINLPILNNEEREIIGTIYKQQGQAAAVAKGYSLVSGETKESRIKLWRDHINANPSAVLYCFRGGQRSQITQKWLSEIGVNCPLIEGGYKVARKYLMEVLEQVAVRSKLMIISGPTGSGKTQLIKAASQFCPSLDLEGFANHRGSAFGAMTTPQPSQVNFENVLATNLLCLEGKFLLDQALLVEDESRLIGRIHIPEHLFSIMRSSQVIWLDEPLDARVENIFKDYILDSGIVRGRAFEVYSQYRKALLAIQKKLGGLRTQEILGDLNLAEQIFLSQTDLLPNKVWIEKLLRYYYDPLYLGSLERRQVKVFFRGSFQACLNEIRQNNGNFF